MRRPNPKSTSIFRDIADAVESLGEQEVRRILRSAVAQYEGAKPLASEIKKKGGASSSIRVDLIRSTGEDLQKAASREDAKRKLEMAEFSRRELEALARSVDVPVRKDLKVADIEDLIVNMTVGGRLNSQAIRGTSGG